MKKDKRILEVFKKNKGYAQAKEVLEAGFHHSILNMLVQEGEILKVKRGLYRLSSLEMEDELEGVVKIIPEGIVCLFSAWNYHALTDFVSSEYHVAIEKSRKIVLPDYPPIKLYFWTQKYWEIGIEEVLIGNTTVRIYNQEKSVCDALRFRNKIGQDTTKEVLKNYLKKQQRDVDKLLQYARLLRVGELMKMYLNILL
ncbi:MAG: type IV toxin-antitoxin system AbiEi family antitoxin domain-containing protein [Bacteroidota bacterium]